MFQSKKESKDVEMTTIREAEAASRQGSNLPDQHVMVDIEAPPPCSADWEGDEDDRDGCLLDTFTAVTGTVAGCADSMQNQWFDCGMYLRERRFWICKIIIVIMDMAILRGAISMGAEYCAQHDEMSEFGWILWASFLVFCKFVYLRPVYHVHMLGVFHGSVADARKSFFLELLCLACHVTMFASFAYRAVQPGYAMYISGSCASRGKGLVADVQSCSKAMSWLEIWDTADRPSDPQPGSNRTVALVNQPPGCYYTPMEGKAYFNPVGCSLVEDWCHGWLATTYGQCSKNAACVCECTFASTSLIMSCFIFFVPMPLQWRMLESSVLRMLPRAARPARAAGHAEVPSQQSDDDEAPNAQQEGGGEAQGGGGEAAPVSEEGWPLHVDAAAYSSAMEPHKFGGMEGLYLDSAHREAEGAAAGGRVQRLHRELRALPKQLLQHPSSSTWVRYDPERPHFLRVAITVGQTPNPSLETPNTNPEPQTEKPRVQKGPRRTPKEPGISVLGILKAPNP